MKKVALITGCSTGLGKSVAVALAEKGFAVCATMRNLSKKAGIEAAAQAANVEMDILHLDVTDLESIESCVAYCKDKYGRLDVLINNAGAGFAKTTEHASDEEVAWVMDVNFNGVVRCTRAVLAQMREQKGGHVINISSVGGLVGQPFNELYCAAKFAVEGYTEGLASYLTPGFGIQFSLVEPGGIRSAFMQSTLAATSSDDGLTIPPYKPLLDRYLGGAQRRAAEGQGGVYQTPEEVAEVIVEVIQSKAPPLRIRTSDWAEELTDLKTKADPDGTRLLNKIVERFL